MSVMFAGHIGSVNYVDS